MKNINIAAVKTETPPYMIGCSCCIFLTLTAFTAKVRWVRDIGFSYPRVLILHLAMRIITLNSQKKIKENIDSFILPCSIIHTYLESCPAYWVEHDVESVLTTWQIYSSLIILTLTRLIFLNSWSRSTFLLHVGEMSDIKKRIFTI